MRLVFMGSVSIGLLLATTVRAQDDRREQRRQFVEGILRTLVDSQLKNEPQPPPGVRQPPLDPRLRDAHTTLRSFSEESSQLILALRQEDQLSPSLRPILTDVLRVKATCDVLVQRAPFYNEQQFAGQFQQMDRDWRGVSHRLRANSRSRSTLHWPNRQAQRAQCSLVRTTACGTATEIARNWYGWPRLLNKICVICWRISLSTCEGKAIPRTYWERVAG